MPWIKKIVLFLVHSNLLISISSALITYATLNQLQHNINWYYVAFMFFTTLFTYNFQRAVRLRGNPAPIVHPTVSRFLLSAKGVIGLVVISALFLVYLALQLPVKILLLLTPAGLLSVFYAAPVFRYKDVDIALREVPYLKIYLIVLVWVWATVIVPYFLVRNSASIDLFLLCLERALFIISLTIPFDVRDLSYDYPFQKTIPQMLGVEKSIALAVKLALAFGAVAVFRYFTGAINFPEIMPLLLSAGLAAWLINKTNRNREELFYTGLLDSVIWVQGFLLLLFTL